VSLLQYSSLYCPRMSVLQQLVIDLDVSVQQQPVLCQKMACSSLWCTWTVCLQEPVLHRDVSVYKSFCVHLRCLSNMCRACAALMRVCLQELFCSPEVSVDYIEPVLHLFLYVYKSFVQHLEVSIFKSLCCICAFLSTRALFCICACMQFTRVLCCTWTCLPTRVQCMLYLEEHSLQIFWFCSVFFETCLLVCFGCFDRNTEKTEKYFFFHIGSPIF
jgi:hypothetical protein